MEKKAPIRRSRRILVAGGQLDPNLGALLRQVLRRRMPFVELLVGPNLWPSVTFDLQERVLAIDGKPVSATSAFIRHDVFLQQHSKKVADQEAALNWYHFVRGWSLSVPRLRVFNRASAGHENNKVQNLFAAKRAGLRVPETHIAPSFSATGLRDNASAWIEKPIAGGQYTLACNLEPPLAGSTYPKFVQRRLRRPETRVYIVGDREFGFEINSDLLDYRIDTKVKLTTARLPHALVSRLRRLARSLQLDFCAIDLMRDDDAGYVFLEVNTQPMFVAFDAVSNGAITNAIIDHLDEELGAK